MINNPQHFFEKDILPFVPIAEIMYEKGLFFLPSFFKEEGVFIIITPVLLLP